MSIRIFARTLADLLLESEEATKDWITVPRLRHSWYLFCGITAALALLSILRQPLSYPLESSARAAHCYRLALLSLLIACEVSVLVLALNYYKFILARKAAIRLDNILLFYMLSTLFFSAIYYALYSIDPSYFIYHDPPLDLGPTYRSGNFIGHLKMKSDFTLFSGFSSLNASFYKIQVHSTLVSVATFVQTLFTLALIGLFVASYVNQKTK